MRENEIEAVAMKTMGRATRPWTPVVAVLLALMQGACGGGGVTGPSAIGGPVDALSLSGTWRGGSVDESLVWQLTQKGDTITGSSSIADGGGWIGSGGNVVGTLSGSSFRFHESHPVGTTSIPGCSVEVEGVLRVSSVEVVRGRPERPGNDEPTTFTKMRMWGSVSGRACGGDLNSVVTLVKD